MKHKIPNILSILRIVLSPVFYLMFVSGKPTLIYWSFVVFTIGALTDYFDGWLARKMKATSKFGKFFDPLADKFLTSAAFIAFVGKGLFPVWMLVIVLLRDFGTTLLRLLNVGTSPLKTSKTAKLKTTLQMIYIFLILALYVVFHLVGIDTKSIISSMIHSDATYLGMLVITLLTFWSLVEYLIAMFKPQN